MVFVGICGSQRLWSAVLLRCGVCGSDGGYGCVAWSVWWYCVVNGYSEVN